MYSVRVIETSKEFAFFCIEVEKAGYVLRSAPFSEKFANDTAATLRTAIDKNQAQTLLAIMTVGDFQPIA